MDRERIVTLGEFIIKSIFDGSAETNPAFDEGILLFAHNAIALLKEQEVKELTIEEWQAWKKDKKHDPICLLWEHDFTPIWILDANDVHEPTFLMGKCKLFKGKPSHEQCKAVKWDD